METYPPGTGSRFLEIFQIFPGKYRWHPVFSLNNRVFVLKTKNPGHYEENEEMMEEKTASRMVSF